MKINYLPILTLLPLLLVGCGGDSESALTYTGTSTQAVISDENAQTVVVDSMSGTGATSSANGASSGIGSKAANKALNYAKSKALVITEDLRLAPVSYSDTLSGTCGGTMAFDATIDDVTFEMHIVATFSDYCEDDTTMSGSMVMDMTLETGSIDITFTNLTVVMGAESITMSGTMVGQGLLASTLTLNIIAVDNVTSEQVKLENFVVTTGETNVEISGRIYTSTSGYVDVTTLTPMNFDTNGDMTSGSLKFSGDGSYAILSAASGGGYTLETDTDGDGIVDTTVTGAWADLSSDPLLATF